jgi:dTDP-4-amino-4,6-dideoxygalactose transaminase
LDSLLAAVLGVKLNYRDQGNAGRRQHAAEYQQALADTKDVILPCVSEGVEPVWHIFALRVQRREELMQYLEKQGISTGIHYPIPIHLQPAYADLKYKEGDFPITEQIAKEQMSLPMYAELTPEMVDYVSQKIKEFFISFP